MNYKQALLTAGMSLAMLALFNTFEPTRDLLGGGANKYFR